MLQVSNFRNKGFTIIEMVVVMAIFLFIVGAAFGIFIYIVQAQKKVLAEQQLLNQISYAEEYMSKALRMAGTAEDTNCLPSSGDIYLLTNGDSGFYKGVKFINESDNNGTCQEFFVDNATPGDLNTPLVLWETRGTNPPVALTSTDLKINFFKFVVNGSGGCTGPTCVISNQDNNQPRITIVLDVKIPGDSQEPNRVIQTTVSRRNLNVNNGQR